MKINRNSQNNKEFFKFEEKIKKTLDCSEKPGSRSICHTFPISFVLKRKTH
jgi:hypothetical protein